MISLLAIVALGFFLGMRHATDPDHVIAVSTIVSREAEIRRAALVGIAWGIGHTVTILVVGAVIILFHIALPPRVGLAMEMAVGVMLIFLGVKNIGGLFTRSPASMRARERQSVSVDAAHHREQGDFTRRHASSHSHSHSHAHDSQDMPLGAMDRWFKRSHVYLLIRPLLIGIVHGLAGSAAIALLVLATISRASWAVAYIGVFGLGTILGMMLITVMIGSTFAYGKKRFVSISRHFGMAAGLISLGFGIFIAWQIGIVDGLFTSHVHWTPH